MTDQLTILGNKVEGSITADRLETFPAPETVTYVAFTTDELTAFCPITQQPDLYRMELAYTPDKVCVESKSLKLYLHSYRDQGAFAETLAGTILADVVAACSPIRAEVQLIQQIRGGLQLTARAEYESAGSFALAAQQAGLS